MVRAMNDKKSMTVDELLERIQLQITATAEQLQEKYADIGRNLVGGFEVPTLIEDGKALKAHREDLSHFWRRIEDWSK